MFSNRVVLVPLSDVVIERDKRQRTSITPESVLELAESIGTSQWIAPILIDQDTNRIVAGERRFTATTLLNDAVNGNYSSFDDPDAAKLVLYPVQTCKVESWHNWSKIPAQLGSNFTDLDLLSYEFIENHQRLDLTWQDKAKAVYQLHAEGIKVEGGKWNNARSGKSTGLDHSTVAKYLKVWRPMEDEPTPEVKLIVRESPTLNAALQSLTRYISRRQDDVVSLKNTGISVESADDLPELTLGGDGPNPIPRPGPAPGTPKPLIGGLDSLDDGEEWENLGEELSFAETIMFHDNAHEWAAAYKGEAFNFIHCDFPYGIDFNTGPQGRSVDAQLTGDYDDSPEVYWDLLNTLAAHRERLIAESAHVMFWFSQNLEEETKAFFREVFPDATVQTFKLIWHCSDGDGIVPDPQRYGRRTYETAMLLTFGDRKIVSPKALSVAAPRGAKSRIHRSMKPPQVLHHFMSMFVDDASSVLDLTAGSGSSLLVAHQLRANRIVGLELDEENYHAAVKFLNERQDVISL
jgi:hypothetical protein